MAETKVVGGIDPDYRMEDHHSNHNGFGSISPDDHHDNNNVDTLLSNQRENNNNSGQSSLDHNMNGPAMETQPRYLMDSNRGKISNFYVNGDKFFPGRKIVHNPKYFKDLPHYLDYLTDKLEPRFGAIRKICTPKHGHRVLSLQDIRENCDYVVVGAERFKPFQYDQITPSERKKSPPFKYDVDPVVHNRRLLQSGKINKIETRSKLIKVWPNGDDLRGPRRVLLSPRINPFTLTNVMAAVNEIMKEDLNGTVEKLYFVNGIKVSDVDQISHNGFYVACKKSDRFKNCRYSESGTKNLSTSPRLERKFLAPLNYSRSNNSTQSSPEHSNASTQNSTNGHPPRRRAPRRDDEQVFPARPVKHTRSSEKNRAVDLDKDQGGMFKAKQNNRTTHGAREVQENRHTRTELPVDQRQAKPVEEERLPKGKKQTPGARNGPSSQGGGVEARTNSKRSPPTGQQQQQQRQKKESPAPRHDELERQRSAAKIQAGYRGYKTRQELKGSKRRQASPASAAPPTNKVDDDRNNHDDYDEERNRAAAKIQAGVRGHQSRQRSRGRQSEPEVNLQQEDTLLGEEERAAAKIQAGFRGFQTRRKMKERNVKQEMERRREEEERAASKIQAGYRGFSSRKSTRNSLRAEEPGSSPPPAPAARQQTPPREDSYDSLDREIAAATKIQSSYRGYVARRQYGSKRAAAVILHDNLSDKNYASDNHDDDNTGDGSNRARDDLTQSPSSPLPIQPKENENENQVPESPLPPPRSLTPPLVSNERAVDRFRSSAGEIHGEIHGEMRPSSQPASPQRSGSDHGTSGLEGAADGKETPPAMEQPEQETGGGQERSTESQRSPSSDHSRVKGQEDRTSPVPLPAQNETGGPPEQEVDRVNLDGESALAADVPDDPAGHGKQNGHAKPLEGTGARESDVNS